MHGRSLLLTGLTILAIPASAGAATLPARISLGPAQGVTASATGRTLSVGFTGAVAAWGKAHAGRTVKAECQGAPVHGPQLVKDPEGHPDFSSGSGRVSADGTTARIAVDGPAGDLCVIDGAPEWELAPSAQTVYAAVTPAGVTSIDELLSALRMGDVVYAARPHGVYAPAADVVALGGGEVVALDDPNGTPPAGKIGYWSKGRAVSLIAVAGTGRRLVLQDLGGGMLRSNVLGGFMAWGPAAGVRHMPPDESSAGDDEQDGERVSAAQERDVHARIEGDRVVFRFAARAAKAYRRLAGHRVRVACFSAPPRALLGEPATADAHPVFTLVRVPRHGGTIRGAAPAGHRDLCGVETLSGRDVVSGPLTGDGLRYTADALMPFLVGLADNSPLELAEPGASRYPGLATLVASHPGLIGLPTPGAPLKDGQTGVWTDADQRALVAFAAQMGLRYVVSDEGDGMVRTNLYAGLLVMVATAFERFT